jgi:hypothetical protein
MVMLCTQRTPTEKRWSVITQRCGLCSAATALSSGCGSVCLEHPSCPDQTLHSVRIASREGPPIRVPQSMFQRTESNLSHVRRLLSRYQGNRRLRSVLPASISCEKLGRFGIASVCSAQSVLCIRCRFKRQCECVVYRNGSFTDEIGCSSFCDSVFLLSSQHATVFVYSLGIL